MSKQQGHRAARVVTTGIYASKRNGRGTGGAQQGQDRGTVGVWRGHCKGNGRGSGGTGSNNGGTSRGMSRGNGGGGMPDQ